MKKFELHVYGSLPRKSSGLQRRLDDLEKTLWGVDKDWSIVESIENIENFLFAGTPEKTDAPSVPQNSQPPTREDDGDVDELVRRANDAELSGDSKSAEIFLRRALTIQPNSLDANFSLGSILEKLGQDLEALKHFEVAYQIDPSDIEARDAVSALKHKLQAHTRPHQSSRGGWVEDRNISGFYDPEDGIADGDTATTPQNSPLSKKSGPPSEADEELISKAANSFKARDFKKAIHELTSYLQKHQGDDKAEYALAKAYEADGDISDAQYHLERALEIDPYNSRYSQTLKDLIAADKRKSGVPDYARVKTRSDGIVPMKPETGERIYKISHSGYGNMARYALAGAALGAGLGGLSNMGMGRGALQGGLMGLAIGLMKW